HEFENISEGINPIGTLYFESPKLYGAIDGGGNFFEFDTQTHIYQKKPNQHNSQIRAIRNGKLYGSTGLATIFEFDLASDTFQELLSIKLNDYYSGGVNSLIVHSGDFHTSPVTITEVIGFIQGKRKDGKPIVAANSNPQEALYYPNSHDYYGSEIKFVSLGYGGSITLAFDNPLYNKPGIDINIAETSYGDPSFYDFPEKAEVFVSQDGAEWLSLGFTNDHPSSYGFGNTSEVACKGKLDSQFDMQPAGLSWIKYIKIVDTTDPMAKRRDKNSCAETSVFAFNAASDGFDLDAIFEHKLLYPNYVSGRSNTSQNSSAMVEISAPNATALLYPNPVSNLLSINLGEEQELAIMEDEFHLEIFDTQGKTWTNSRELLDESWIINHDVSKLNPGMYIARVTNGNVRRYYKFMKK
ncbi:MAG TPA: T9SS type A sorting domain-containing protein, partial [Chryseolinea sp.]|nr:T9SS type A sorting domain-containing protein [Chryseolinea sp.]